MRSLDIKRVSLLRQILFKLSFSPFCFGLWPKQSFMYLWLLARIVNIYWKPVKYKTHIVVSEYRFLWSEDVKFFGDKLKAKSQQKKKKKKNHMKLCCILFNSLICRDGTFPPTSKHLAPVVRTSCLLTGRNLWADPGVIEGGHLPWSQALTLLGATARLAGKRLSWEINKKQPLFSQ